MAASEAADVIVEGRWHVVRRAGWWVVDDLHSHPRETVTGGYLTKREAVNVARAIAGRVSR